MNEDGMPYFYPPSAQYNPSGTYEPPRQIQEPQFPPVLSQSCDVANNESGFKDSIYSGIPFKTEPMGIEVEEKLVAPVYDERLEEKKNPAPEHSSDDESEQEAEPSYTLFDAVPPKSSRESVIRAHPKKRKYNQLIEWSVDEVSAIENYLGKYLSARKVPGKSDCKGCLRNWPEVFHSRKWYHIKMYIKNKIAEMTRQEEAARSAYQDSTGYNEDQQGDEDESDDDRRNGSDEGNDGSDDKEEEEGQQYPSNDDPVTTTEPQESFSSMKHAKQSEFEEIEEDDVETHYYQDSEEHAETSDDDEEEEEATQPIAPIGEPPPVEEEEEERPKFRRIQWSADERAVVDEYFGAFIRRKEIPGKIDCEACLDQHPEVLKRRKWTHIKFHVRNKIVHLNSSSNAQQNAVTNNERLDYDESTDRDMGASGQPEIPSEDDRPSRKRRTKEKKKFVRRPWSREEVIAVEKYLKAYLKCGKLPGKKECEACIDQTPDVLRHRNWTHIKFFIKNRLSSMK